MPIKNKINQIFVNAECSKCGLKARVQDSHMGRKHKVCGGKRTVIPIQIPSMAWTYGKHKKAPLFGRTITGEAARIIRIEFQGDRREHGTWGECMT